MDDFLRRVVEWAGGFAASCSARSFAREIAAGNADAAVGLLVGRHGYAIARGLLLVDGGPLGVMFAAAVGFSAEAVHAVVHALLEQATDDELRATRMMSAFWALPHAAEAGCTACIARLLDGLTWPTGADTAIPLDAWVPPARPPSRWYSEDVCDPAAFRGMALLVAVTEATRGAPTQTAVMQILASRARCVFNGESLLCAAFFSVLDTEHVAGTADRLRELASLGHVPSMVVRYTARPYLLLATEANVEVVALLLRVAEDPRRAWTLIARPALSRCTTVGRKLEVLRRVLDLRRYLPNGGIAWRTEAEARSAWTGLFQREGIVRRGEGLRLVRSCDMTVTPVQRGDDSLLVAAKMLLDHILGSPSLRARGVSVKDEVLQHAAQCYLYGNYSDSLVAKWLADVKAVDLLPAYQVALFRRMGPRGVVSPGDESRKKCK